MKGSLSIRNRFLSLLGGNVAGQLLMITALPIVTTLFEPADFGMLGAFGALVMLVLPAACLRFDVAIPVPDDEMDARALAVLSFLCSTVFSVVYWVLIQQLKGLLGSEFVRVIDTFGWLLPLTLWAAAVFSFTQFWAVRSGLYRKLALAHASRGLFGAGTQVGLGLIGTGTIGLLLGQAVYMGLGSVALIVAFLRTELRNLRKLSAGFVFQTARRNWRFPVFSVPESLLDSAGANLPILLIVYTSGPEDGGFLYLAQRITSIPIGIIGGNLSRVYLGEARKQLVAGTLFAFTKRMMRTLLLFALGPFLIVFFGAPFAFERYLSADWANSVGVLQLILPAAFLQFCVVPVSTVFHVRSRQFAIMLLQACGLILQVGPILICFWTGLADPITGLAVGAVVYYSMYVAATYLVARS